MAYASLPQQALSDTTSSDNGILSSGPSSSPRLLTSPYAFQPLSMDFDNLDLGNLPLTLNAAPTTPGPDSPPPYQAYAKLASDHSSPILPRSPVPLTSHKSSPFSGQPDASSPPPPPPHRAPRSTPALLRVRTTSSADNVDLMHPSPDLQSMQGAYVGNVQRLERSAESMGSNLEEEVRKVREEQKRSDSRRSSLLATPVELEGPPPPLHSTYSNSIVGVNSTARSGGYSPAGYVSLSRDSSSRGRSASRSTRLTQLPEPELEGQPLAIVSPIPSSSIQPDSHSERPRSVTSTTSSKLANTLFQDFDGEYDNGQPDLPPPTLVTLPPPQPRIQSHVPRPDSMVFYPAPVPRTLNLPKRLSKQPPLAERENRQSQVLDSIPNAARQSALWLPGVEERHSAEHEEARETAPARRSRPISHLPPQLRASAFFDPPGPVQEVAVKDASAVATLDSILDASAKAPVRAFTDHPIAGEIGSEVYRKEIVKMSEPKIQPDLKSPRKRRSSLNLLLGRRASGLEDFKGKNISRTSIGTHSKSDKVATEDVHAERRAEETNRLSYEREGEDGAQPEQPFMEDEELDNEPDAEPEPELESEHARYSGPPTTLLAELQMRKQQTKNRNRTAATAFPNGMHSTLLELDQIAQLQNKTHRKKRVALAWEDPNDFAHEDQEADDDDVPLGVLFPGRDGKGKLESRRLDDNRPLGLIDKRALEDNEPLSKRRNRLLGIPNHSPIPRNHSPASIPVEQQFQRPPSMYTLDLPGLTGSKEHISDEEGETLAQRRARLQTQGAQGGHQKRESAAFADELIGKFGGKEAKAEVKRKESPEQEETLGQRRRRLQAANQIQAVPSQLFSKQQYAITNILQAHPAPVRQMSYDPAYSRQLQQQFQPNMAPGFGAPMPYGVGAQRAPPSLYVPQPVMGFNNPNAAGRPAASVHPQRPLQYNNFGVLGMDEGPPLDAKQRSMIDNWRHSVMPS
ncbi:MAG: hypothetical protein M1814_005573 [Vezdaea aestivalis]|nr:MAG: hypothetical protein M1814_005573 [Vezdaea aestivalis]